MPIKAPPFTPEFLDDVRFAKRNSRDLRLTADEDQALFNRLGTARVSSAIIAATLELAAADLMTGQFLPISADGLRRLADLIRDATPFRDLTD